LDRVTSLRRPSAEGSLSIRRGTRPNPEREEMLESEQFIEAEASKRRGGRRCSVSLKDRPGRETCRKPSACAGSNGSVATPQPGKRVNLEREEMRESEQIIEQEATIRRGRRCSLSLKGRPGRETCRKGSAMPGATQTSTPSSGAGSSEGVAASLARALGEAGSAAPAPEQAPDATSDAAFSA